MIKTNNSFVAISDVTIPLTVLSQMRPHTLSPPKVSKKHHAEIQERVASKLLKKQAASKQAQMAVNMAIEKPCIEMSSLMSRTVSGITGGINSSFGTETAEMSIDEPPDYDSFMSTNDDYFGLVDDTPRADGGA